VATKKRFVPKSIAWMEDFRIMFSPLLKVDDQRTLPIPTFSGRLCITIEDESNIPDGEAALAHKLPVGGARSGVFDDFAADGQSQPRRRQGVCVKSESSRKFTGFPRSRVLNLNPTRCTAIYPDREPIRRVGTLSPGLRTADCSLARPGRDTWTSQGSSGLAPFDTSRSTLLVAPPGRRGILVFRSGHQSPLTSI
jgi:hypothetical protein